MQAPLNCFPAASITGIVTAFVLSFLLRWLAKFYFICGGVKNGPRITQVETNAIEHVEDIFNGMKYKHTTGTRDTMGKRTTQSAGTRYVLAVQEVRGNVR